MNSSISYDPLEKDKPKLKEMDSNISIKNLSGNQILRISMDHNFYKLKDGELINIWKGELPRLTSMDISTNMLFKLFGSKSGFFEESEEIDITADLDEELYYREHQAQSNNVSNLWETTLGFSYSTHWQETKEWDYTFSLNTTHKINLTKNWLLSYTLNFNLKEKEIIQNTFSIYRPLHCWEFSFSYRPGNSYNSGFSLRINVRNPDLRDIKLTSKSPNLGFGGF